VTGSYDGFDPRSPLWRVDGRDDGVKKLPGFLGSVVSRVFLKPHIAMRILIRRLQDDSPLESEPMCDSRLDNPRERNLPDK
jgi:hypothetical protein